MASGNRIELLASQTIDSDTTTVGSAIQINRRQVGLIGVINVSTYTDGTYTLSLEESPDGTNWVAADLATSAAIAAAGADAAKVNDDVPHLVYVRASVLSASTTTGATIQVDLHYEDRN